MILLLQYNKDHNKRDNNNAAHFSVGRNYTKCVVYHVNVGQYDKSYSWKFAALCVITLSVPAMHQKKRWFQQSPISQTSTLILRDYWSPRCQALLQALGIAWMIPCSLRKYLPRVQCANRPPFTPMGFFFFLLLPLLITTWALQCR